MAENSYQESLNKTANAYKNCFCTDWGQVVLDDLKRRYRNSPLLSSDMVQLAAAVANHDLIVRIEYLIAVGKGEIKAPQFKVNTEPQYDPMKPILPIEN